MPYFGKFVTSADIFYIWGQGGFIKERDLLETQSSREGILESRA